MLWRCGRAWVNTSEDSAWLSQEKTDGVHACLNARGISSRTATSVAEAQAEIEGEVAEAAAVRDFRTRAWSWEGKSGNSIVTAFMNRFENISKCLPSR